MTSKRDRRVLAIGIGACALVLAIGRGASALRAWYAEERDNARDLATRLAQARRSIASRDVTGSVLAARAGQLDSISKRVFVGRGNAAAAAAASHVTRLARASRVEVIAVQIALDSASTGPLRRIGVSASARADIRGLTGWLAALESGAKHYEVVALSVSQQDVAGAPGAPEALTVQLTLRALTMEPAR